MYIIQLLFIAAYFRCNHCCRWYNIILSYGDHLRDPYSNAISAICRVRRASRGNLRDMKFGRTHERDIGLHRIQLQIFNFMAQ